MVSDSLFCLSGYVLSHSAFEGYLQQFLCLDGKLHRQFVHHLFGIAVHNQTYRVLQSDTALLAVEELVLVDFAGGCLVFHGGSRVANLHIRERVRTALVAQEQAVALAVVAGIRCLA